MNIKLNFELIYAIVSHGTSVEQGEIVDLSVDPILEEAGVAKVTSYIEQLSLLDIISNPTPIFGSKRGMWIGYSLTDFGRSLTDSEQKLREAVAELTGDAKHEVSQSVFDLLEECSRSEINETYQQDFLRTLEEIAICFDDDCYIATIGLCGKNLEVCLKEILIRHKIGFDVNWMVGTLIKTIKEKIPAEYLDPTLGNVSNIINTSRITAVHAKERIPVPSRDQAVMVIFATRDVVRRNLSRSL